MMAKNSFGYISINKASKTFSFILCLHNVHRILKQLRRDNRGDLWNFDEKFFAQSYDVTCQKLTSDLPHYYSSAIKLVGIQMISISLPSAKIYHTCHLQYNKKFDISFKGFKNPNMSLSIESNFIKRF